MLSPVALVPIRPAAGIILNFQVDEVAAARERVARNGATILIEPMLTDWETESLLIAGSEEMVIDLYRWVGPYYIA